MHCLCCNALLRLRCKSHTVPTCSSSLTHQQCLELWQEDERVDILARLLTEEWDTAVLMACGAVYKLCEAPCPFPCIEYPLQTDNTQIKSSRQMDLVKV